MEHQRNNSPGKIQAFCYKKQWPTLTVRVAQAEDFTLEVEVNAQYTGGNKAFYKINDYHFK